MTVMQDQHHQVPTTQPTQAAGSHNLDRDEAGEAAITQLIHVVNQGDLVRTGIATTLDGGCDDGISKADHRPKLDPAMVQLAVETLERRLQGNTALWEDASPTPHDTTQAAQDLGTLA